MTSVKQIPILFNDEMVREILAGRKTQTRRVVKVQPPSERHQLLHIMDSTDRRQVGKSHWAILNDKKTSVIESDRRYFSCPYGKPGDRLWVRETFGYRDDGRLYYRADQTLGQLNVDRWKPSIHMPRSVSRITLEITGVRLEKIRNITLGEICKEGLAGSIYEFTPVQAGFKFFAGFWDEIYGSGSWDANPWVWVIEFKRVDSEVAA